MYITTKKDASMKKDLSKKAKITILKEFKKYQKLKAKAEARYKELKEQIQAEIDSGKYGDYVLAITEREVKEYTVPARTDTIVKVDVVIN